MSNRSIISYIYKGLLEINWRKMNTPNEKQFTNTNRHKKCLCYINIEKNSESLDSHRKMDCLVLLSHIEGLRKGDLEHQRM